MKKIAVLVLFSFALAYGQANANDKPVVPASQDDVQKLQKELQRMRLEAKEAEKNSASRNAEEREKAVRESKAAISTTEQKLTNKLESIAREAQQRSDDQLRTQRIVWFITLGIAVLIGVPLVFLLIRRSRRITTALSEPEQKTEILRDPDITALRAFSARNGGIAVIPFILVLQDGREIYCVAKLRGDMLPVVFVGEDKVSVAWDKRRRRAAAILDSVSAV